jgi:anion-transporting  ArsA/GET3 family ATPase
VAGVDSPNGGGLYAKTLDMKRTFDEIVLAHTDAQRAEQILANPFYVSLSSSFAGTQEYMAMEKLGQLRRQDTWDLIVVDTPPSRSALDFLDAPQRLGSFLDGRLIRLLALPAKAGGRAGGRLVSASLGLVTKTLTRILGAQLLKDVQSFVAALDTMFGGFRERADETYRLLQNPETRFLVVATPERDALREATYFVRRLAEDDMPLAGMVLNRVHRSNAGSLSAERALTAAEDLEQRAAAVREDPEAAVDNGDHAVAAALLLLHADRMQTIARERRLTRAFTSACPATAVGEVVAQPGDVHDLAGLRLVGQSLSGKP